jgi:hypothetical protein
MPLLPAGRKESGFGGDFARSAELRDSSQADTRKRTDASSWLDNGVEGERPKPPKSAESMLRACTSCKVSASLVRPNEERMDERDSSCERMDCTTRRGAVIC